VQAKATKYTKDGDKRKKFLDSPGSLSVLGVLSV
jgi:hypothetical protein